MTWRDLWPGLAEPAPRKFPFTHLHTKATPNPEVSLLNAEGLPASSFMTDDVKPPRANRLEDSPKLTREYT